MIKTEKRRECNTLQRDASIKANATGKIQGQDRNVSQKKSDTLTTVNVYVNENGKLPLYFHQPLKYFNVAVLENIRKQLTNFKLIDITKQNHDNTLNTHVEGHLQYKGFIAQYWNGDEEDGEQDLYVADMANIHEAAFVMEGNNLQELTQDFHEMVDDFLTEVDNGGYGGEPIEYYTNDKNILDYYNKYHRKNVVQLNPYRYEQEVPFRMAA